ncbi:DUF2231 domain-containing protein [Gaopeijia maritima]|uniref:DUF2231 domain-containing protein n=1 Tax=Gaopeijia maritima TaxID=3119007 RepID=A0ABU9EB29_9BACT
MGQFIGTVAEAIFVTHPLHSMIVHFPIALSAVGLLFVVLALVQGSTAMEEAAFVCILLTAITGLLASFSGYRDVIVRFDGEASYVGAKAFLGVTMVLLSGAMAFARVRWPRLLWNPSTMILYVAGFAVVATLSGVLGFLGGVILYGF